MTVISEIILDIDLTDLMNWLRSLFPPNIKESEFNTKVASDWHSYVRRYIKLTFGLEMISLDKGQETLLLKRCFIKETT